MLGLREHILRNDVDFPSRQRKLLSTQLRETLLSAEWLAQTWKYVISVTKAVRHKNFVFSSLCPVTTTYGSSEVPFLTKPWRCSHILTFTYLPRRFHWFVEHDASDWATTYFHVCFWQLFGLWVPGPICCVCWSTWSTCLFCKARRVAKGHTALPPTSSSSHTHSSRGLPRSKYKTIPREITILRNTKSREPLYELERILRGWINRKLVRVSLEIVRFFPSSSVISWNQ